jgi:uncharacterized protein
MTVEKPFIHMLKTPLRNYVYDVNTNQFIDVDEETYRYLRDENKGDSVLPESARVQQNIQTMRLQGFLSAKHPKEIRHNQSDLLTYHLNENIMSMALQVTQRCNFRCAYCPYCASDFELQRNHSSKRMPLETALTAIDFFAARCGNQELVTVGFYGGEPLLEFPLIQRVVAYAKEKLYGKDLMFTVTTNASLLTPDMARFFSEHNFSILISLDGTPETHDRSRRFADTGRGSFAVIRDNLETVREECPDFKYSFNIVIDPRYPCDSLHQLFSQVDPFREIRITSTLIDDKFSVEKAAPGEIYVRQDNRHCFRSYVALRGVYDRDRVSRVAHKALSSSLGRIQINMKPAESLPDVMAPGGPCIAGERRLFVSVDGDLYPCERVSETSQAMNIGNLWDGFDFDKVDRILNIAQTTAEDCKNCWAFRHCTLCCRHSDNCGELSADLRRSQCDGVRAQVEDRLRDYLWMREFGVSYDVLGQEV